MKLTNAELCRQYYKDNKEAIAARKKRKYQEDPNKSRDASKAWREANKDKIVSEAPEKYKKRIEDMSPEKRKEFRAKNTARSQKYYNKNKQKVSILARERYLANKPQKDLRRAEIILFKGGICCGCGMEYNGVNGSSYDFHHLKRGDKLFEIGRGVMSKTDEELYAELEKTILLCSNCHRLEHNGVDQHSMHHEDINELI